MVALPLFDIVISSDRAERSVGVAARLVQGALADLRQIEMLEEGLAPAGLTQFDRQSVALIRGMYEQWANEARGLLDRAAQVGRRFGRVEGAEVLHDSLGRTLAMLSISIDDMETGSREILDGRMISGEEVRRELRLHAQ
jgi:hypothetical protein